MDTEKVAKISLVDLAGSGVQLLQVLLGHG
jgi:hypothetical protein